MKQSVNPSLVFAAMLRQHKLPEATPEYRFHGRRKWRFDYAWPAWKVALEVEGGVWTGGAHGRGTGITRDIEKYNHAAAMGWLVVRCLPRTLNTAETFAYIKAAMEAHGRKPDQS